MAANDPIEQLFVELSLAADKFRKDVKKELEDAGVAVKKNPPQVPLALKTDDFTKQVNKAIGDYQTLLKKSLGVLSLQVDTKPTQKGIQDAVKLFMTEVPKLQKAGTIDLKVQKDKLKASIDEAIKLTSNQINASGATGPGVDFAKGAGKQLANQIVDSLVPAQKATADVSKQLAAVGSVAQNTAMSMVTSFAETRDPITTMVVGIQALNVGLGALDAAGVLTEGVLATIVAPIAAIAAALAAVLVVAGPVIGFLKDTATQGQQMAASVATSWTGVRIAANNAGVGFDSVNKKIQQLEATGITTTEALGDSMKFLTNQLPIDDMDKLARSAQNVAVAFNQNSSDTLDRFVYAITTGNTEVLNMVGITKTAVQMEDQYASSINKTTSQLTEAQKKQAIMAGIMQQATSYTGLYEKSMESLGKQIGSLPRYIEQGTLAFGQTLTPFLAQAVKQTTAFWQQFQSLFVKMKMVKDAEGVLKATPETTDTGDPVFTKFGQQIYNLATKATQAIQPVFDLILSSLPKIADGVSQVATNAQNLASILGPVAALLVNVVNLATAPSRITQNIMQALSSGALKLVDDALTKLMGRQTSLEQGWELFKQAVVIAVAIAVGDIAALNAGLDNLFSIITGHGSTGSWKDFAEAGRKAAADVINAMSGVKGAVEDASQPPKITIDAPAATPDYDAQKQLEAEKAAGQQFLDMQQGFQDQAVAAEHQFQQSKLKAQVDGERQSDEDRYQFGVQEYRAERQSKLQLQYMARDFRTQESRALEDFDTSTQRSTLQRTKEFNRQQVLNKQQFLLEMQRMEQDYTMNLEDAVRARDAKQVLRLQRQHGIDKTRKQEDFDLQQTLAKQQLQLAIDDEKIQREYLIQDQQKGYKREIEDFNRSQADQKAARAQAFTDQMTDFNHQQTIAAEYRNADYQTQLKEMDYQNGVTQEHLIRSWGEQGDLTEKGAKDVLGVLDKYYGAKGSILATFGSFVAKANKLLTLRSTITISVGPTTSVKGSGGTGSSGDGSSGDGTTPDYMAPDVSAGGTKTCPYGYQLTYNQRKERYECKPRQIRAQGGLDVVNKPTAVTMGDAGQEAHLFLPMNNGHIALPQLAGMLGGGAAGGRNDKMDVTLKVTADSNLPAGAADEIYMGVAQIMATQMGIRIEGR